jgi:hypothetical protein
VIDLDHAAADSLTRCIVDGHLLRERRRRQRVETVEVIVVARRASTSWCDHLGRRVRRLYRAGLIPTSARPIALGPALGTTYPVAARCRAHEGVMAITSRTLS